MSYKYLILDFGKVLAYPVTEEWFILPKFFEIINKTKFNKEKFDEGLQVYKEILGKKLKDESEEFEMMTEYYKKVLEYSGYKVENIDEISDTIAKEFVYENDKYKLYEDVKEALEKYSKKYILICLSDNWPSGRRFMKDLGIYDYFDRVYISSDYGYTKYDKLFFDEPIKDYGIKTDEAIFVDVSKILMDIAKEKGFVPMLMDRNKETNEFKYKVLNSLADIEE